MKTEIITIGDELLIGQVIDTNSAWMGKELNKIGLDVVHKTTIGDDRQALLDAFESALNRVDVVLVTGGIGPTKDDITKHTLCDFFETELVFDNDILAHIEEMFASRNIQINELTKNQAYVPRDCTVIQNTAGTAPITWFERNGKVLVSMPGVPIEMKTAMTIDILPRLKSKFNHNQHILHRTYSVKNYPESALALRIAVWENALPAFIRLAYLPAPGVVRLRLTGKSTNLDELNTALEKAENALKILLEDNIFDETDVPVGEYLGKLLKENGLTIAVAESCTGGYIAHQMTSIAGSSTYFKGGVVVYSNEMKQNLLGVSNETLQNKGAVSGETAREMIDGVVRISNADVVIATTGIAGPDGGSDEKPVGTVWIGIKVKSQIHIEKFRFGTTRETNIQRSSLQAMLMAAEMIIRETKKQNK